MNEMEIIERGLRGINRLPKPPSEKKKSEDWGWGESIGCAIGGWPVGYFGAAGSLGLAFGGGAVAVPGLAVGIGLWYTAKGVGRTIDWIFS